MLNRRFTIVLLIAGTVPAFALTHLVVNRHRAQREALAEEWSQRGDSDLAAQPIAAVTDFETALAYRPDRTEDRFGLAKALVAAHRDDEAGAQLLTLAADNPAGGEVNLELARIAARENRLGDAVRYYHAAIDGVWRAGASSNRHATRIELARLLMGHDQPALAQAELIALTEDLPPDANLMAMVGKLLWDAGAPARALALFRRAAQLHPSPESLDESAREMLAISGRVLALDPYADRLSVRTRAARATRALAIARSKLDRCPPMADLSDRVDEASKGGMDALVRDPDLVDDTMSLVFEVEKLPAASCAPDTVDDRALMLVAAQHAGQTQ